MVPLTPRRIVWRLPWLQLGELLDSVDRARCVGGERLSRPGSAPDSRAGGGAPEMGSRLSTLATYGFGV